MRRPACVAIALSVLFLLASSVAYAGSSADFMNFNYLQNMQQVGSFYSNYGVTFSSNFYGLRSDLAPINPGSGNFAVDPTKTPAIFICPTCTYGTKVTGVMNVANGFTTSINFFYTSTMSETITVWSGANGTGTVLATLTLSANNASCGSGQPMYCNWSVTPLKGLTFNGTAHSVTFTGGADAIGITDITLGQNLTAVPEPSTLYLLGTGIIGLSLGSIRRFFKR